MRRADTPPLLVVAWIAALGVAGVDLFAKLGNAGWQTDEPVYRNAAAAMFRYGNFSHNLEHPLVGKYLIGLSRAAFGDSAWATRLPSAVATLLAGLVLAALAVRILRPRASAVAARWAGLATFATWTLLPHPDPAFDVARLAYLDAPLALFVSCAMYAAWRWQEAWSWRWAAATGVAAGLAVGTKVPALFLAAALLVLVVARGDAPRRRRALQYVAIAAIAAITLLVTWAPLGSDLPHALHFLVAMQRRDVHQTIEVAGHTYRDGAPVWTQAWWQWDAWPAFAVAQLVALLAAAWVLPRRAAAFVAACILLPAVAYAVGGGRILPHWQATWQPAMSLLLALVATSLIATVARHRHRHLAKIVGTAMLAVVAGYAADRTHDVVTSHRTDERRVADLLARVDEPGAVVVVDGRVARTVERDLTLATTSPSSDTYHSAASSQHGWITHDGGRPTKPRPTTRADVAAIVARQGDALPGEPRRVGRYAVGLLDKPR
ncbi:MAG: glycosyl transferase family 39 [Thermoleophilia bacterium]|nr:glycosyl transferase family 39 [Thermoleophilia bacterium]